LLRALGDVGLRLLGDFLAFFVRWLCYKKPLLYGMFHQNRSIFLRTSSILGRWHDFFTFEI
jgi:hypothetical protein